MRAEITTANSNVPTPINSESIGLLLWSAYNV
jgi:hypothetical protein